jgi:hypothetical protein
MKSGKYALSMFFEISMFCSLVAAQQSATASSSATVPRLVNFSGKTTDPQGKAISGIAGVTFAIYKDQYEGASLWLETQNVQADTKGNYTVQLGATKPDGLPLDLFSLGDARWLGVTVNGGRGTATRAVAQRALRAEGSGCGDHRRPAALCLCASEQGPRNWNEHEDRG